MLKIIKRLYSKHCYLQTCGPISRMILDRADRKNALGKQMLTEINECIDQLNKCDQTKVLIIESNLQSCFSAGADLKERKEMSNDQVILFVDRLRNIFDRIAKFPFPTIAKIADGVAVGGGLEIALACDLRFCNPKAKMGLPETKLAILPAAGGSQRLWRIIGTSKAKELIFTGRIIGGLEAAKIGLVNDCIEDNYCNEKVEEVAKMISENGPLAIKNVKLAIDRGQSVPIKEGLEMEKMYYDQLVISNDRMEGLEAFSQKRKPSYRGK